ncbi:cysteine dioxygenase [Marinobacterium sedimentorum]|uniref:cysteine dioxygenase family protein n=1 Tax=Marinobacterium sedimentorum TaxID=2927804 RepID=UPI0020C65881|nr:cysteine dioxygenase [Marinobacterium sedimentorum]MCP8687040.1 cysteine dioxygenase [Marinobacterium sedimentorum]
MHNTARLRDFVQAFTVLVNESDDEAKLLDAGEVLLADLIRHDDWLPDAYSQPGLTEYQQYLLHCDPLERFSVVSFVWGPGQCTPIHDHQVWGMVGVLRGLERCEEFAPDPQSGKLLALGSHELHPGSIDLVSPRIGDIHRVSNGLSDAPSVSIHVYGGNIGAQRRNLYDPGSNAQQHFISGYSNGEVINLWDRSDE